MKDISVMRRERVLTAAESLVSEMRTENGPLELAAWGLIRVDSRKNGRSWEGIDNIL